MSLGMRSLLIAPLRPFRAAPFIGVVLPFLVAACGNDARHSLSDAGVILKDDAPDASNTLGDAGATAPAVVPNVAICSSAGWCWDGAGPQANTLNAVAANAPNDVWAVGALGEVLHFDGTHWSARWAPTKDTLRAIWLSGSEAWAVGDNSTVLHYADGAWESISVTGLASGVNLRGVAGEANGLLWIAGDAGTLFERRDGSWTRIDATSSSALNGVWSGAGKAYAVGDGGLLLVRENDVWAHADSGTTHNLFAVHGDATRVWVGGQAGDVRRYNAEAKHWERPTGTGPAPSTDVRGLQVGAGQQVYVADASGNVHVWDAAATCPVPGDASAPEQPCPKWGDTRDSGQDAPILGLWASGDQSIAVGAQGLLVSWTGAERRIVAPGSLDNYLDVSGTNAGQVWVAGDRLLERSEGVWKELKRDSPRAVYTVGATAAGRLLVAGTGGMARSYSDATWETLDVRADAWLHGLSTEADSAWLVGSRGQAWGLLNGRLWTPLQTPTDHDLLAVWSAPTGTAWAVGEGGVTLHHDGLLWAAVPSGPNGGLPVDLRGVWGAGDKDVWAVGTGGSAVHWDGVVWTRVTPDAGFSLNDVWGRGPNDVWAVGTAGTLLHYDGTAWSEEFSGTEHTLNAIWGNGERIWAVGEHGTILVKQLQ